MFCRNISKVKNDKDYLVRPDKWWDEREIISEL